MSENAELGIYKTASSVAPAKQLASRFERKWICCPWYDLWFGWIRWTHFRTLEQCRWAKPNPSSPSARTGTRFHVQVIRYGVRYRAARLDQLQNSQLWFRVWGCSVTQETASLGGSILNCSASSSSELHTSVSDLGNRFLRKNSSSTSRLIQERRTGRNLLPTALYIKWEMIEIYRYMRPAIFTFSSSQST